MKLSAVFATACLLTAPVLAAPGVSHAEVHLLVESNDDRGGGNELLHVGYADRTAFTNGTSNGATFLPQDIAAAFSVADIAYDGKFRMMVESRDDRGGGNELLLVTYDTYADLLSGASSSAQFLPENIAADFSVHGFTCGDGMYQLLVESNDDRGAGNELLTVDYNSFDDLTNGTSSFTQFLPQNIAAAFSVAGLAFNNGAYDLLVESRDDRGAGNEVLLVSYADRDAFLNGTSSSTQFLPQNIAADFSIHGFEYEPEATNGGGGGGGGVPEPSAWALMILGFGAIGAAQRRRLRIA